MSDDQQGRPPIELNGAPLTEPPQGIGATHDDTFPTTCEVLPPIIGRPTLYTPELAAFICQYVKNGGTLYTLCKRSDMPDRSTIHDWRVARKEFAKDLHIARQVAAEGMADDALGIADEGGENAPLQVRTRMWLLACNFPQLYGSKVGLGIGSPPTAYEALPAPDTPAPTGEPTGPPTHLDGQILTWRRRSNGHGT